MSNSRVTLALLLALVSLPVFASAENFRVWQGPILSLVPPDSYNKPVRSWLGKSTMLVQVVVVATGGSTVDASRGHAVVYNDKIKLCYRMQHVNYPQHQPIPAVAFPMALEYTISGLSAATKYEIFVERGC